MSRKINIGGDPADKSYRYKRDELVLKKHGVLWEIANINEVCKQLQVGKEFTDLFYGKIKKRGIAPFGTSRFKGQLTVAMIENILEQLIREKILCPNCHLPEWDQRTCRACGYIKKHKGQKVETPLDNEQEDEDEEESCVAVKEAVVLVKELYTMALADRSQQASIYACIDCFWSLPSCVEKHSNPAECDRLHKKWRALTIEKFFKGPLN